MNETKICCPHCRTPLHELELLDKISQSESQLERKACPTCGTQYQVQDGILDFTPGDHFYWGEISQEEMERINHQAEQVGWFQALAPAVDHLSNRDLTHYLFDQVRIAGFFHYYDPERNEAVLDLGSGWGPIAFGLSKFYRTVYSMDGVYERLRFQAIRARQEGISNIKILKGSLLKLPFPENSIDTAIVNGLLEWIGLSDQVSEPRQLQEQFLAEVFRVLKPGGKIYIGIENRFGAQYILGGRDHSGLRYTSMMPRWMANWAMKIFEHKLSDGGEDFSFSGTGASYRTLTYSSPGYQKLLQNTGFTKPNIYWVRADYNYPWVSGTLDGESLKFYLENFASGSTAKNQTLKKWSLRLPKSLLSLLIRFFSTDFLIVASKEESIEGLEEKIARSEKQMSFLRTTFETRANLNTAYWFLNGHGLEKIVQLQPTSQDGRSKVNIRTIDSIQGHPFRPDSLPEIRNVVSWLAEFQKKNKNGFWSSEELIAEMDRLVERAYQLVDDPDLLQLLVDYSSQYRAEIPGCDIPIVAEHGSFIPANILVSKDQDVQLVHWENSTETGNPMMDAGGVYLSIRMNRAGQKEAPKDNEAFTAAFCDSYHPQFEMPLYLSPGYFALRSLDREMGEAGLNPENYVSWKYWEKALKIALKEPGKNQF